MNNIIFVLLVVWGYALINTNQKVEETMPGKIDLIGHKYNQLTVVSFFGRKGKSKARYYNCICDCGTEKVVSSSNLRNGGVMSCGCLGKRPRKHGMNGTPIYIVWKGMVTRCHNENSKSYKYYGAKGVLVCPDWRENFISFYKWALENGWRKGLHVDRIKNEKGYSPKNCRIVSAAKNMTNKGVFANNTTGYTGVSRCGSKFLAYISTNGKRKYLGVHATAEGAVELRNEYIKKRGLGYKIQRTEVTPSFPKTS